MRSNVRRVPNQFRRMVQKANPRCCGGLGRWGMSSCERDCAVKLMRYKSSAGEQIFKTPLAEDLCGIRLCIRASATRLRGVKRSTRPPLGVDLQFTPPRDDSIAIGRPVVRDIGPACRGLFSYSDGTAARCSYLDDCALCDNARHSLSSLAAESVRQRE